MNPSPGDAARVPNFLIAGAPKSGTSSVHSWLADHPETAGSLEKETYFLVDPGTHMYRPDSHVAQGLDRYARLFPADAWQAQIVFESTPAYLYSRTALDAVAAMPSPPRVLFILREPAAQIQSLFSYFQNNWDWIPADMSFADFITACRAGDHDFKGNDLARDALRNAAYVDFLLDWRQAVGADNMRVTLFDDLAADPVGFTKSLATWLGIDPGFYDAYAFPRDNETYVPRSRLLQKVNLALRGALPKGRAYNALRSAYRRMNTTRPAPLASDDAALRAALRDTYVADNARLAEAFNLDLTRWSQD